MPAVAGEAPRARVGAAARGRAAAGSGRGGPRRRGGGGALGLADDRLGDAAHRVAAGVALGQEPQDHARVAGRDRVLEHVEGQQLEPGEALLAAEAGEVAVVLDEAGEGGLGEKGVELGLGQPLDARDLGGRHAGGEPHAEAEAGAVGQGAGAARNGDHGGS